MSNIAAILNDVIVNDPILKDELKNIPYTVIVINIIGIKHKISFQLKDGMLTEINDLPADYTEIKASPFTFLMCLSNLANGKSLPSGLNINGDVGVVTKIMKILGSTEIDWEQFLSTKVGDTSAGIIFTTLGSAKKFFHQFKSSNEENIKDFMQDEVLLIPTRTEFSLFQDDVSVLRDDVERLAVKIATIEK
jgi:ubiquinone biosynthesis protein UbiJ